ncbi:hypothetical protein Q7C18_16470 [Nesterenkonia sp. CL21]|nr:hypothetical protein [Nesterenkonia sp. CL21]MDS2174297.1 hypothetical protein [Nesterenkonia sp. CL21]
MLGETVEQPAHCFAGVVIGHAPMMAQQVLDPTVGTTLQPGGGPFHGSLLVFDVVLVEEGEQGVIADQLPVESLDSAQTDVGVPPVLVRLSPGGALYAFLRVGALLEEGLPSRFPGGVGAHPGRSGIEVLDSHQFPGQGQDLLASRQSWVQGGVPDDGGADVEVAALDTGAAPLLIDCGPESGAAVGDHHIRGREPFEQGCPGGFGFFVAPLPADHMGAVVGDEHAPSIEVGAINDDLPVNFPGRVRLRDFDIPAP